MGRFGSASLIQELLYPDDGGGLGQGFKIIAMTRHEELLRDIERLASSATNLEMLMQRIADRVHATMLRYNGVSFRFVDQAEPGVLIAGVFSQDKDAAVISGIVGIILAVAIPFIYGAMAFVVGCIIALIYNFAAGRVGGVKFELQPISIPPVLPLSGSQNG